MSTNRHEGRYSILCIEDDIDALKLMVSLLSHLLPEFDIHQALDGESGYTLFIEHRPDIVVTDLSLTVMDGVDLAGRIRGVAPSTLIVAVSAYSKPEDGNLSPDLFDHYLAKPLDFQELIKIVNKELRLV
jgi:CheY-like chemotaxis protein